MKHRVESFLNTEPLGTWGSGDLCFFSLCPDTSLHCKTTASLHARLHARFHLYWFHCHGQAKFTCL